MLAAGASASATGAHRVLGSGLSAVQIWKTYHKSSSLPFLTRADAHPLRARRWHGSCRSAKQREQQQGGAEMTPPPRPRILALHGFRTSADIFKAQIALAALRKFFDSEAEVVYINAPHAASGPAYAEVREFFQPPYYEWWNAVQEGTGEVSSGSKDPSDSSVWRYQGMDVSLQFLERYMQEHGPFDGLMGFSQGASVSALAVMLQHKGVLFQSVPKLKFCILVAGGKCKDPQYAALYEEAEADAGSRIPTPACIMIGDQDPHKAMCDAIVPCFGSGMFVLRHPLGHQVPRLSPEQIEELSALIKSSG